jgi:hypothetical protein
MALLWVAVRTQGFACELIDTVLAFLLLIGLAGTFKGIYHSAYFGCGDRLPGSLCLLYHFAPGFALLVWFKGGKGAGLALGGRNGTNWFQISDGFRCSNKAIRYLSSHTPSIPAIFLKGLKISSVQLSIAYDGHGLAYFKEGLQTSFDDCFTVCQLLLFVYRQKFQHIEVVKE